MPQGDAHLAQIEALTTVAGNVDLEKAVRDHMPEIDETFMAVLNANLEAAQKANGIDQTLLPAYYFLGYAYTLNEQYADAIRPLQLYLVYQTKDGSAYALLGQAYAKTGDYESAIAPLKQALKYDPNQVRSYIYLGTASLRTDDIEGASEYFKRALDYYPDSFDANIGLTEAMYRKGTFGSAYLQAEASKPKATNDTQLALVLYWRALSQEGRKAFDYAMDDWEALLAMPEDVMTAEMRQTAEQHLAELATSTPTPKGGIKTATSTATPKASGSSTPTPTKTPSATPSRTPTPTATKTP